MNDYRHIPYDELLEMWQAKRFYITKAKDGKPAFEDVEELFAMRRELDRRSGKKNPTTEVNFEEDYLTD